MELSYKRVPFQLTELKAVDKGWEVAGYASTWGGEPDSWGDIVAKGAFANSLAKRQTKLLWQHDMGEPIGKQISLAEDDKGLFGRWSIVPTDTGTKAHQLLEAELVDSLSIGFITIKSEYNDDGVRVLKEVDLYEVSLVTIPANASAVVTSFKAASLPFTTLLEQAGEALRVTTRAATALRERRAATHRPLNDQHTQAIGDFLAEAEALHEELSALVVVAPEAKAPEVGAGLELVELELAIRRRKYHFPATSEVA